MYNNFERLKKKAIKKKVVIITAEQNINTTPKRFITNKELQESLKKLDGVKFATIEEVKEKV